ncbi:WAT1-related protein [Quillaja saponaria]|uniref:WAT1-related protein n=1 Tax=Quillaja saponaria TaxID=32244 RepID=A0AAD7M1E2_QUISA|nr:WAT1-related protein [Quillaja saponaria]
MGLSNVVKGWKAVMAMVVTQITYAGMNILYKLVAEDGMNLRILIAYRLMFASAFMLPLALILERNIRPKMTWVLLFQSFLCALLGGTLSQNLYIEGLALTSATFSAAVKDLIPATTFIIGIMFGLEKLAIGTLAGKFKVMGTVLGISGALVFTFYKGVDINIWSTHINLLHHYQHRDSHHVESSHSHLSFIFGASLCLASCLTFTLWLIVQTKMSKKYPCPYSSTALMSVIASIQSVLFSLCIDRDWSQWRLGWNIRLATAAYTGIVSSGLAVTAITWCVNLKGPLFVSIFNPLCLVVVAILDSLLLNDKLNLGSILGGLLIICGLYMVLWGKSKEMKALSQEDQATKNNQEQPQPQLQPPSHSIAMVPASPANICQNFRGSLQQNLYVKSLALVSPTYATTMINLTPAVTFILAVAMRLDRANFGTPAGKAKVLGTLIGVGGAMTLTFYKGVPIHMWSTHIDLSHHLASSDGAMSNQIVGSMLALATCFSYAIWLIIQGIVASGLVWILIAWCVRMKGPLFVSIFNPLLLVLVSIAGSLVLDETLHLGSLIGAMLIVGGLYMVLWGKNQEMKKIPDTDIIPSKGSTEFEVKKIVTAPMAESASENNNDTNNIIVQNSPSKD